MTIRVTEAIDGTWSVTKNGEVIAAGRVAPSRAYGKEGRQPSFF